MGGLACASCGAANEADARFCESCGTSLQRACGACGVVASPTARFCRSCGSSLDDQASQPISGPTRKVVTVLFADLAGSTAFEEVVDPETAREVIGQYHDLLRSTAQRHRAGVTKYIGDGFMAVWGVPEIGAGDAEHAVDAAIELQERFVGLARRFADIHEVALALRVAVNTGEVVVGSDDADLVGDALNVGARLESECPHGHVVVGEETWRATRGRHRYEPLGTVQVKGRSAPVPVYQWVTRRTETAESIPFIGRTTELRRLRSVLDDAMEARGARLVTVVGDPGVGKTRLAMEFLNTLGEDIQVIRAQCAVEGSPAMTPLVDVLRTRDLETNIAEYVPERARILRDLAGMTAGVAASVEESFWALRRFVEVLAADRPVVMVVDDIQWADNLLLDFVEHLVEWVRGAPVLLVGLARPELRESRPDLVTVGGWVADALRLRGLEASATAELAAQVLGSDQLPQDLLSRLPSSTGGNPLFVRELVGMLVHDGVLVAKPGGWTLTVDVDAISVPPTIHALLASRLERLEPANRRVLEVASVIGTDFSPSAVAALAGAGGAEIQSTLNRLRRLDLAQPTGTYAGDEPVWRFHHVLIRDVAYRRLLKSDRAELHERLANWVHAGGANVAFEADDVIARNLEAAHGYRCDLGLRDGQTAELALRSARNYLTSARRALDRDELDSAGNKAARGAALAVADPALQAELLLIGCEAFLSAGDVTAGASLVDDLEVVAGQHLAPWASCYRCQLVVYTDPTRLLEVDARLQQAIDEFTERKDLAGLAKAHRVRANARARLGRIGDCESDLFEALIAARQGGDHRQITAALGAAPNAALWGPSPAPKAGGRCLDVVRMQRMTTAAPSLEATSLRCLAVLELLRGRPDKARSMLAESRQVVAELGLRHGVMETELFAGIIELMVGDAAAAEPHFRVALEGLDSLGVGADAGQAAALLARSVLAQGRLDEADKYATESERIAGHNLKTAIAWRSVRAEIFSAEGDHDRSVLMARDAVAVAAKTDLVLDHADACLALGRVLAAAGDELGAAQAQRDAVALYAAKDAVFMVGNSNEAPAPAALSTGARTVTSTRLVSANHASEAIIAGFTAGTLRYCESVVYDDRRAVSGDPIVSSADFHDAMQRKLHQFPHVSVRVIAVRGNELALFSLRWSDDAGNETVSLDVFDVDAEGLTRYHGRFDDDDFASAYRELEVRYYAGEGSEFAENGLAAARWLEAVERHDVQAVRALTHPDFRWVAPPEALKTRERSVDNMFAWTHARSHQVASQRHWVSVHHWLSPTCSIGVGETLGVGADGEEYRWSFIFVGECRDGLMASTREFDITDEDSAYTYAESLTSPVKNRLVVANRASGVGNGLIDAIRRRDIDAVMAQWSDHFTYDDRRRISGDPIRDLDSLRAATTRVIQQYTHFEAHNVAVRGDRVYLGWSRWSDDSGNAASYLGVYEIDADGLVVYHGRFDEEDFWSAYREMENHYYAAEGAQFATNGLASAEWVIGINQGDIDAVRRVSDPGFRWLAPPSALKANERSVDDMFRWMQARSDQVSSQRHWVSVIHWLSTSCAVALAQIDAIGEEGQEYRWNFISVGQYRDGLLRTIREFIPGEEDEAFAYADRQIAKRSDRMAVTNRASEIGARVIAALTTGDVDGATALFSAHITYEDRRDLFSELSRTVGLTSARRTLENLHEQFAQFHLRTLAVRGDRLSLEQFRWSDDAGNQTAGLLIGEIDDSDLICYQGFYNEHDFEGAYRELERRNSRDFGPTRAAASAAGVEQALAETRGDLDAAFAMFSRPGLVIESRSRSVFPRRTAEELRQGLESLRELVASYRVWASVVYWMSDELMVIRHEREAFGHDGENYSWSRLYVAQVVNGLFTALCEFDAIDEDAAFQYAEELARGGSNRLALTNRGTEVGDRVVAAVRSGDIAAAAALYSDGAVHDDHRRLSGDPITDAEAVRSALERLGSQYTRFVLRTLGVRGERLSLVHAEWSDEAGNESTYLMVGEIGGDGRITYQGSFDEDDFEGAYRELERRYYAGEGAAFTQAGTNLTEFALCATSGDLDRVLRRLAVPDLRIESRSRSIYPERTVEEFRSSVKEFMDSAVSLRTWFSAVHWLSPNCVVGRHERESVGHDGATYEWTRIYVGTFRDGLLTSLCDFDTEFEAEAFEYAEDRAAAPISRLAPINRASAVTVSLLAGLNAHDLDKAAEVYSDRLVYDDHRQISGDPITDHSGARAAIARICAQYSYFEGGTLAVRGDRLELAWSRLSDDAGNETSGLVLIELDEGGRIAYEARFDEDDFDSAYRELEHRYYAGQGAFAARSGLNNAELIAAMNRADYDTTFNEFIWPDLLVENRSHSGFPDRPAADLRASFDELHEMVEPPRSWFPTIVWMSPDVFVARLQREGIGRDGERYEWSRVLAGVGRDGRLARLCDFDNTDEQAAFSWAHEMLAPDGIRLVVDNRATAVIDKIIVAVETGDIDAGLAHYVDNYLYDDRRRLSGDPIQDKVALRPAVHRILQQFNQFERRMVAVRGEGLALMWSTWSDDSGNATAHLQLIELGADGRIERETRFDEDDFEAAYRELERRYYTGEGAAFTEYAPMNTAYVLAMNRGDFDTMFNDLTWPDMRVENHSRSGFPDRSADELRASLEELYGMLSLVRSWFSVLRWLSPTVAVTRLDREGTGHDGEQYAWARILVVRYRDGRLAYIGEFDADDDAAAFAHAEQLLAE